MRQEEFDRKLALLQRSIDSWQESLKRHCFEIKYGKIHEN
jgi:hypothetical protein